MSCTENLVWFRDVESLEWTRTDHIEWRHLITPPKKIKILSSRLNSISKKISHTKFHSNSELLKSNLSAYGKIHYGTRLRMRMILEYQ